MLFKSLKFAVFFPIATALYFLLPHRSRWAMLLFASRKGAALFSEEFGKRLQKQFADAGQDGRFAENK